MSEPEVTAFQDRVYGALSRIPRGCVTTYARLGQSIGCNSARC